MGVKAGRISGPQGRTPRAMQTTCSSSKYLQPQATLQPMGPTPHGPNPTRAYPTWAYPTYGSLRPRAHVRWKRHSGIGSPFSESRADCAFGLPSAYLQWRSLGTCLLPEKRSQGQSITGAMTHSESRNESTCSAMAKPTSSWNKTRAANRTPQESQKERNAAPLVRGAPLKYPEYPCASSRWQQARG